MCAQRLASRYEDTADAKCLISVTGDSSVRLAIRSPGGLSDGITFGDRETARKVALSLIAFLAAADPSVPPICDQALKLAG